MLLAALQIPISQERIPEEDATGTSRVIGTACVGAVVCSPGGECGRGASCPPHIGQRLQISESDFWF